MSGFTGHWVVVTSRSSPRFGFVGFCEEDIGDSCYVLFGLPGRDPRRAPVVAHEIHAGGLRLASVDEIGCFLAPRLFGRPKNRRQPDAP